MSELDEKIAAIRELKGKDVTVTVTFTGWLDEDGDVILPDGEKCIAETDDGDVETFYLTAEWLALHAYVYPILPDPEPEDVQAVIESIEATVRNRTRDANA